MRSRTQQRSPRRRTQFLLAGGLVCLAASAPSGAAPTAPNAASEAAAVSAHRDQMARQAAKIGRQLRRRHLPHGTVFDPVFASPSSNQIVGYIHAADAAIWTGHYVAAQAFEFAETRSKKTRRNIRRALKALRLLVDLTGNDVLARAAVPSGDRWEGAITSNNPDHIYRSTVNGVEYVWVGNTSRDQYSGVFFGLGFAWELVPDRRTRALVTQLTDQLLGYLINNAWTPRMPDGALSTTFLGRPDQQLAFLQIGRMVNPDRFEGPYREMRESVGKLVEVPILAETTDPHGSYFKFNLDHINLVHLVRLEKGGEYAAYYRAAWQRLRQTTGGHQNAHFNLIARLLDGPDAQRDAETRDLLQDWLRRPRRIGYVDLSAQYAACGDNRACEVIPVHERPPTDFLWQRSPFQLSGGLGGDVEGAGIDYLLPYWMARYLGVL